MINLQDCFIRLIRLSFFTLVVLALLNTVGVSAKETGDARPLKCVYFVPSDCQPYPDRAKRLYRVMKYVQDFYRSEMERNGFGPMTAAVEYSGATQEEKQQPPVFTNKMKKGNLKIIKTLSNFESSEPATFVFEIIATAGEKVVYTNVASITFSAPGEQETLVTGIPIGSVVKVKEVYSGARYTGTVVSDEATILAQDEGTASVSFTNSYDNTGPGGHGILNSFTAV